MMDWPCCHVTLPVGTDQLARSRYPPQKGDLPKSTSPECSFTCGWNECLASALWKIHLSTLTPFSFSFFQTPNSVGLIWEFSLCSYLILDTQFLGHGICSLWVLSLGFGCSFLKATLCHLLLYIAQYLATCKPLSTSSIGSFDPGSWLS